MFILTTRQSKIYLREAINFMKNIIALDPIFGKFSLDKD